MGYIIQEATLYSMILRPLFVEVYSELKERICCPLVKTPFQNGLDAQACEQLVMDVVTFITVAENLTRYIHSCPFAGCEIQGQCPSLHMRRRVSAHHNLEKMRCLMPLWQSYR